MADEINNDEREINGCDDTTGEAEPTQETAEAQAAGEGGEAAKYKALADEYLLMAQRVQADFDNFRRRTIQEREDQARYCSQRMATNLLPVLDNFERALEAGGSDIKQFLEGMELIYKQFKDVLEREGVKAMDAMGQQFDPNFHEAVMQTPSEEHPDNTVIEEFQKGYMLVDRVIRPSMVKVAKS